MQAMAKSWFGAIRDRATGLLGTAQQKMSDVFKATHEQFAIAKAKAAEIVDTSKQSGAEMINATKQKAAETTGAA